MNKQHILALVVVAVLVAGFIFWKKRQAKQLNTVVSDSITPFVDQQKSIVNNPQSKVINLPVITILPGKVLPGYPVYAIGTAPNVRKEPSTTSIIVATVKGLNLIGSTSGEISTQADGKWIKVYNKTTGLTGWVRSDVVRITSPGANGLDGVRRS